MRPGAAALQRPAALHVEFPQRAHANHAAERTLQALDLRLAQLRRRTASRREDTIKSAQ